MARTFVLLLVLTVTLRASATPPTIIQNVPHDITISIDPKGFAYIGRDTLTIDKLAFEVQQRLWKSYLGTGRMYDHIKIELKGDVLMGTRGSALDAIKLGQEKALAELCVLKFKKEYDNLTESQQRKLQKQFPVLFQPLQW
jgi:hypothetical protein